jgi:hypothetical protein
VVCRGLSHALLAAALSYEPACRRGAARAIVLVLCAVSAIKPVYELVTGAPAFAMALGDGVVQMPLAHVAGVLAGIVCGLGAGIDRQRDLRAAATAIGQGPPASTRMPSTTHV